MLTHKQVEQMCDTYFEEGGWVRIQEQQKRTAYGFPDRHYKGGWGSQIYVEVKPPNADRDEIRQGIGQCCLYHSSQQVNAVYLVIDGKWRPLIQKLLPVAVPWLRVLLYYLELNEIELLISGQITTLPEERRHKITDFPS